jgi:hypothetical protein
MKFLFRILTNKFTKAKERMEQFIQEVSDEGPDIHIEIPYKVDGVQGHLTIEFDECEDEYNIMFEWVDIRERYVILDNIKTPEDVGKWLILIKNGKFYSEEPVFTEKKRKWVTQIRKLLLESENKEPEMCYVCMEDTFEYKTPCNHDICYSCFVKTIQKRLSGKRMFVCGICRKRHDT